MKPKLREIKGVEVFSAGVWNGDEYSIRDLDEMVLAFEENKKHLRPALKLGHDENQALLQRDGMPAAGWVTALYRKGKKLVADFSDIPGKIYDLMERGAYKKVSAEIWWNTNVNDKQYRRLLTGIALLGADMPGVMNLADIFERYSAEGGDLKVYELEKCYFNIEIPKADLEDKGEIMDPKEQIAKLEAELKAEREKNAGLQKDYSAKQSTIEAELAEIKKQFAASKEREQKAAADAADAKLDSELAELVSARTITPAMKPYVKALLGEEKKEYSFDGEKKGESKKFSKAGLLQEILKLHAAKFSVNTEEGSEDGDAGEGKVSDDDKALDEKIQKYAKEHDVSYKVAYKAVMSEVGDDSESDEAEEATA